MSEDGFFSGPMSILDSFRGFTESRKPLDSSNRPNRIGTIDAAYVNATTSGNPRVLFDGETVMGGRTYAYVESYLPKASDRVILAPFGPQSYVIIGKIGGFTARDARQLSFFLTADHNGALQNMGITDVALTNCSLTFTTRQPNAQVEVTAAIDVQQSVAGSSLFIGTLKYDSVAAPQQLLQRDVTGTWRSVIQRTWIGSFATPGSHSVSLFGRLDIAGSTIGVQPTHTTIIAKVFE